MDIFGYGEDALTLWAVSKKLDFILKAVNDKSPRKNCKFFYRPSFGRRGGENSPQFGEFDFLLLSEGCLYLGESKWSQSSESIVNGKLILRSEQLIRHRLFQFYVEQWAFGSYSSWHEFQMKALPKLHQLGIRKPLAQPGSKLTQNLQTILRIIHDHFDTVPKIQNLLLYFHKNRTENKLPQSAGEDFRVIGMNYSDIAVDNLIMLD